MHEWMNAEMSLFSPPPRPNECFFLRHKSHESCMNSFAERKECRREKIIWGRLQEMPRTFFSPAEIPWVSHSLSLSRSASCLITNGRKESVVYEERERENERGPLASSLAPSSSSCENYYTRWPFIGKLNFREEFHECRFVFAAAAGGWLWRRRVRANIFVIISGARNWCDIIEH